MAQTDTYNIKIKVVGGKVTSAELKGVEKSVKGIGKSAKKTGRDLKKFGGEAKIAFAAVAAGAVLMVKSFAAAASEAEQYEVRLRILLGSQEEGNRMFKEMAEFAGKVPFEYRNVMNAATQLAGVMRGGVDEVTAWMPLIADLAATAGLGIELTTGQIVRMYSAGAGAADLFRDRGILAMLGFKAKVAVTAEETQKVLIDSWQDTNSKFRGATAELAKTWVGKVSMMKDAWFQFQVSIMEGGLLDYMKDIVVEMTEIVRWMNTGTRAASRAEELAIQQKRLGTITTQIERIRETGRGQSTRFYFSLLEEWHRLETSIKVMTDFMKGTETGAKGDGFVRKAVPAVPQRDIIGEPSEFVQRVTAWDFQQAIELMEQFGVTTTEVLDIAALEVDAMNLKLERTTDIAFIMGDAFAGAFTSMALGAKSAGDAMSSAFLGAVGQMAIQYGSFHIAAGAAEFWLPGLQGSAIKHMAAGAALMALGGTLQGVAGGIGGGRAGSARGGAGGGSRGGVFSPGGNNGGGNGAGNVTVILLGADGRRSSGNGSLGRRMITESFDDQQLAMVVNELKRTGASLD